MAIKIRFDAANNPEEPTVILARKNGKKLGKIEARSIELTDKLNDAPEMSFKVYKYLDGEKCRLWDEISDFKLLYCVEWNLWFEITVELDESEELVKTVFCTGLGHAELSQIMLYDIQINTEDDIARDEYTEPTIFYNEKNHDASLLHRITEKAPHYEIAHVDSTLAKIQRTFEFDDTSICDAFHEVAQEINCLFVLNVESDGDGVMQRTISVYDLESKCIECGYRGEFTKTCPKCGSENIREGYGSDTSIFVDSDCLADSIGFSTDTDSVKNCFKLEAGDDLMTATVRACNPNGSDYIWYISDDTKKEMPEELVRKIEDYDKDYLYYQNDYIVMKDENSILVSYNKLVDKYSKFNEDLQKIVLPIKGYPSLMNALYNTIDFELYLKSSMMPNVETIETDAKKEAAKLTTESLSPVAVQSIRSISDTTADNAVSMMAKLIVDSRFRVKVVSSSFVKGSNECYWTGSFSITNYYDEEDTAKTDNIFVVINEDYVQFVQQKIEKELAKDKNNEVDIVGLFKKDQDDFVNELRKYSLNRLRSFHDAGQACIDILIEQGIADGKTWSGKDPNLYDDLFVPYYKKVDAISNEIKVREKEISVVAGKHDSNGDRVEKGMRSYLEEYRDYIQERLDFEKYIGRDLWLQFCSFKREDKYSNDNYVSDGLNNAEMFELAREFIEVANKEILKSAERQHSITTSLKNLLVIDRFSPLVDMFEVGNWIRVLVDDKLYKLRLIEYTVDYEELGGMSVQFSDVVRMGDATSDIQSVLDQASSMATSYGSTQRQAEKGNKGNNKVNCWVNDGLYLTNMQIVNDADNQNVKWDSHGMLLREYLPVLDDYDDRQLKIINKGLYVTDDKWRTSRAGIGNFLFWNPKTKKTEEAYGVIADKLVGNLILSEEVGIYNKNNSITMDESGFTLTTNADGNTPEKIFTIQKETKNSDGESSIKKLMYVDSDGNLNLSGGIKVSSSYTDVNTIDDLGNPDRITIENNTSMHEFKADLDGLNSKYADVKTIVDEHGVKIDANSSEITQLPEKIETSVMKKVSDGYTTKNEFSTFKQESNDFQWSITNNTIPALQTGITDAARTATDYMSFSAGVGLTISANYSSYKTRISSSKFSILNSSNTELASFESNQIKLGKNNQDSTIDLGNGAVVVKGISGDSRGGINNSYGSGLYFYRNYDYGWDSSNNSYLLFKSNENGYRAAYGFHNSSLEKVKHDNMLGALTLFQHSSGGTTGSITLNCGSGNYRYFTENIVAMEIFYSINNPVLGLRYLSQKIYDPHGKTILLTYNAYAPSSSEQPKKMIHFAASQWNISLGTGGASLGSIIPDATMYGEGFITDKNDCGVLHNQKIKILKVVGYR